MKDEAKTKYQRTFKLLKGCHISKVSISSSPIPKTLHFFSLKVCCAQGVRLTNLFISPFVSVHESSSNFPPRLFPDSQPEACYVSLSIALLRVRETRTQLSNSIGESSHSDSLHEYAQTTRRNRRIQPSKSSYQTVNRMVFGCAEVCMGRVPLRLKERWAEMAVEGGGKLG